MMIEGAACDECGRRINGSVPVNSKLYCSDKCFFLSLERAFEEDDEDAM